MAAELIDWSEIENKVLLLATEVLSGFTQQALKDFQSFKVQITDDIEQWMVAYAQGELTEADLQDLVKGEKAYLKLEALEQLGFAAVALDTFTEGVMKIMMSAVTSAVGKLT